jgi:hypothetical protein
MLTDYRGGLGLWTNAAQADARDHGARTDVRDISHTATSSTTYAAASHSDTMMSQSGASGSCSAEFITPTREAAYTTAPSASP